MPLLTESGILCVTIDDVEVHVLRCLIDASLPQYEVFGVAPIKNNPAGRTGNVGFSICHEYAIFYGLPDAARVGRLEHSDAQKARYKESDDISAFEWTNFRKHGGLNTYRTKRPRQFYPIYVCGERIRIPNMEWDEAAREWTILEPAEQTEEVLLPIDENERERIWDFVPETAKSNIPHFKVRKDSRGKTAVYRKWRLNDDGLLPQTWWDKSEYSAAEYGTNLLTNMFGETHRFTFPKSLHAVIDCLKVSGLRNNPEGVVLDYFAGSGTTAHAVIALNRTDGGTRSYILVDMAEYFDSALMPRIRKAAYAAEWKDGKPKTHSSGRSHAMKYLRLESFEDSLNNLELSRTSKQQSLLDANEAQEVNGLKEQYILRYMLNVEARGSQSSLNVQAFTDPTAYKLKVKRSGSDESREVCIDLLETFNWLIGLTVHAIAAPQSFEAYFDRDSEKRLQLKSKLKQTANGPWWFRMVEGTTPDDRKTLIVWRKLTGKPEEDNLVLDVWMKDRLKINTKDFEFDLIYVNGDNNLENLKTADDTWKVRLIEEDFHRLMFDTEGV
jgi:adenine-specific DNA-methyltransferase